MERVLLTAVVAGRIVARGRSIAAALPAHSLAAAAGSDRRGLLAAGRILVAGCILAEGIPAGVRAGLDSCRIGTVGCRSWTFCFLEMETRKLGLRIFLFMGVCRL